MGCCFRSHLHSPPLQRTNVFTPPKTCDYSIKVIGNSFEKRNNLKKCVFSHKLFNLTSYPWININSYIYKKPDKNLLVVLHINNNNTPSNGFNFIFSGRNSNDLGSNIPFLVDISTQLKVNIIAYDYSGYGRSAGEPSELNMCRDLNEVMDFAVKDLFLDIKKIILIGDSLGTAPSINLALDSRYLKIAGLILISPLVKNISIYDSTNKQSVYERNDIESNLKKLSDINSPIFIIQAKDNRQNNYDKSLDFTKKIKLLYKWFPKCEKDCNILHYYRNKFILKCSLFLELLKEGNKNRGNEVDKSVIYIANSFKIKENYVDNIDSRQSESNVDENTQIFIEDKCSINSNISNKSSVGKMEVIPRSKTSTNSQKFSLVNVMNEKEVEDQLKIFKQLQHINTIN